MDNKCMKQTIFFKILCKRYRTPRITPALKRNNRLILVICSIKPIFTTCQKIKGHPIENCIKIRIVWGQ